MIVFIYYMRTDVRPETVIWTGQGRAGVFVRWYTQWKEKREHENRCDYVDTQRLHWWLSKKDHWQQRTHQVIESWCFRRFSVPLHHLFLTIHQNIWRCHACLSLRGKSRRIDRFSMLRLFFLPFFSVGFVVNRKMPCQLPRKEELNSNFGRNYSRTEYQSAVSQLA